MLYFKRAKTSLLIRNFSFKANHLVYIESRWYGSRISADCQQDLLSQKHDTSGKFLLEICLTEQKREDNTQIDREITCLLENGRDCVEIKSSFREIRVN